MTAPSWKFAPPYDLPSWPFVAPPDLGAPARLRYPVVIAGRLYVREHDIVWCYDVSAK